ncbi:hypothetical protein HDV64DRAFT_239010 [Trichoderma sp. TUCIM 5745]
MPVAPSSSLLLSNGEFLNNGSARGFHKSLTFLPGHLTTASSSLMIISFLWSHVSRTQTELSRRRHHTPPFSRLALLPSKRHLLRLQLKLSRTAPYEGGGSNWPKPCQTLETLVPTGGEISRSRGEGGEHLGISAICGRMHRREFDIYISLIPTCGLHV